MKRAYVKLKEEFDQLKVAYEEISKQLEIETSDSVGEKDDSRSLKKLKKERNKLKGDYKQCMEAVR